MIAYDTDFASLYDVFYSDKPYDAETAFVQALFREHGLTPPGRLLDLACGTGQHSVRFADAGWIVVGVDRSAAMLAVAEARRGKDSVSFRQQDMTALELNEPPFDAAVCLFDSIGYAITNAGILATLTGIRRHVRDGALFVLEFWHAAAMVSSYEPHRKREWSTDGGAIRRTSTTSLDVPRQVARVEYLVERFDSMSRLTNAVRELHENRYFLVQEMALFMVESRFEPLQFFAGFDADSAITRDTWHVVALARASNGAPA